MVADEARSAGTCRSASPQHTRGWSLLDPRRWRLSEERILVLKLDFLLLACAFVAGLTKDMDQSATTQVYVSGMREDLNLYGNELVEFTTYFAIGYALAIIPSQTSAAPNACTIYAIRLFLNVFSSHVQSEPHAARRIRLCTSLAQSRLTRSVTGNAGDDRWPAPVRSSRLSPVLFWQGGQIPSRPS
ncbi:hypothetical protein VTO42DRAFT_717 [Malbranchea cinnamomea]